MDKSKCTPCLTYPIAKNEETKGGDPYEGVRQKPTRKEAPAGALKFRARPLLQSDG